MPRAKPQPAAPTPADALAGYHAFIQGQIANLLYTARTMRTQLVLLSADKVIEQFPPEMAAQIYTELLGCAVFFAPVEQSA
jgi:hypothetical protein